MAAQRESNPCRGLQGLRGLHGRSRARATGRSTEFEAPSRGLDSGLRAIGLLEVQLGLYMISVPDSAGAAPGHEYHTHVGSNTVFRGITVFRTAFRVGRLDSGVGIVLRTHAAGGRRLVPVVPVAPEVKLVAEPPMVIVNEIQRPDLTGFRVAGEFGSEEQGCMREAGFLARQTGCLSLEYKQQEHRACSSLDRKRQSWRVLPGLGGRRQEFLASGQLIGALEPLCAESRDIGNYRHRNRCLAAVVTRVPTWER